MDHKLDSMSNYELADAILAVFEREGMLPPYNLNHGFSNFDMAMGVPASGTYKWEDEDE